MDYDQVGRALQRLKDTDRAGGLRQRPCDAQQPHQRPPTAWLASKSGEGQYSRAESWLTAYVAICVRELGVGGGVWDNTTSELVCPMNMYRVAGDQIPLFHAMVKHIFRVVPCIRGEPGC